MEVGAGMSSWQVTRTLNKVIEQRVTPVALALR
jgi:hypothetical protein